MISATPLTGPTRNKGFSLLELLITVAVAGILAMIAIPNMAVFVQNNTRSSRMNALTTAFNVARNAAISRQSSVTVCASKTLNTPGTYTCNGGNAFTYVWIIMTDFNANGVVDAGDQVLSIVETVLAPPLAPAPPNETLNGRDGAGAAVPSVSFDSSGQPTGLTAEMTGVHFTYCDARRVDGLNDARAIIMTRTGHTKASKDTNGDKIHEVRGVNLTSCD